MSDAINSKYFAPNCTIISQKAKHQLTKEHAFSLQMVLLQRKQLIATHFQVDKESTQAAHSVMEEESNTHVYYSLLFFSGLC